MMHSVISSRIHRNRQRKKPGNDSQGPGVTGLEAIEIFYHQTQGRKLPRMGSVARVRVGFTYQCEPLFVRGEALMQITVNAVMASGALAKEACAVITLGIISTSEAGVALPHTFSTADQQVAVFRSSLIIIDDYVLWLTPK